MEKETAATAAMRDLRACPLCRADSSRAPLVLAQDAWRVVRCSCGFLFLHNPPELSAYQEEFDWQKSFTTATEKRRRKLPVLMAVDRLRRKVLNRIMVRTTKLIALTGRYFAPGRVLDAGCGMGWTLTQLPECFIPFGIEFSRDLAQRANEAVAGRGGSVICGDVLGSLAAFPDAHFTGVVMRSYLEHELEPLPVLEAVRRVLAPDGMLIIKVPNYACLGRRLIGRHWSGFRWPDHVNYFTPSTLQHMLQRAGYRIARFSLSDHSPLNDNMWLVAARD